MSIRNAGELLNLQKEEFSQPQQKLEIAIKALEKIKNLYVEMPHPLKDEDILSWDELIDAFRELATEALKEILNGRCPLKKK